MKLFTGCSPRSKSLKMFVTDSAKLLQNLLLSNPIDESETGYEILCYDRIARVRVVSSARGLAGQVEGARGDLPSSLAVCGNSPGSADSNARSIHATCHAPLAPFHARHATPKNDQGLRPNIAASSRTHSRQSGGPIIGR